MREKEREREREREKGMTGALAPFSYLVFYIFDKMAISLKSAYRWQQNARLTLNKPNLTGSSPKLG